MELRIRPTESSPVLECVAGIETTDDADAIIVASVEQRTDHVLILPGALPPTFYDLRSRFAGTFIQKLVNYRLRVAAVVTPDVNDSANFNAFVREARQGQQFRTFEDVSAAVEWLCSTDVD